jgi:hypothetical protein
MTNGWDTTALQNSIDQCNYANNTGQAGGAQSASVEVR